MNRYILVFLLYCIPQFTLAQYVYVGMTTEDVVEALGKPLSQMARGKTEIWFYPNGVSVEFAHGHLKWAQGVEVRYGSYTPAPKPEPTSNEPAQGTIQISEALGAGVEGPATEDYDSVYYSTVDYQPLSREEEEQQFRNLIANEMGFTEKEAAFMMGPGQGSEAEAQLGRVVELVMTFAVNAVLVLIVVKTAFAIAGATLLNGEALLLACLYAAFQVILALIPWQEEWRHLLKLDEMLSFVVLTLLIFHCTSVTQGITALKLGVGCFVVTYILNYIFLILVFFML